MTLKQIYKEARDYLKEEGITVTNTVEWDEEESDIFRTIYTKGDLDDVEIYRDKEVLMSGHSKIDKEFLVQECVPTDPEEFRFYMKNMLIDLGIKKKEEECC